MSHSLAVVGAGTVFSGDHENPTLDGVDTLIATDGVISAIGRRADLETEVAAAAQVIDANGGTLQLTAANGTVFTVTVPAGALNAAATLVATSRPTSGNQRFNL